MLEKYRGKEFIKKEKKLLKKIIPKRPGTGISPMHWFSIIGKRAVKNLVEDRIIKKSDFKNKNYNFNEKNLVISSSKNGFKETCQKIYFRSRWKTNDLQNYREVEKM